MHRCPTPDSIIMETKIINGRQIRDEVLTEVKVRVAKLPFVPVFCDVLVGDDPASAQYVRMKAKTAESVGVQFHPAHFPATITTEELIVEIKKINTIPNICGLIVQLPIPAHLDKDAIMSAIDPRLDVDCLGERASQLFYAGNPDIGYPTALSCMALLDSVCSDLLNKNIIVIGQGELVGKPVTHLLRSRALSVSTITRSTDAQLKMDLMKHADVIISATGQGQFITGDMIQEGAIIIDAGTSEGNAGIVGDVDAKSVMNIAGALSPVPGGVGPMTVATLLMNVCKVAEGCVSSLPK